MFWNGPYSTSSVSGDAMMGLIVSELYDALIEAGASPDSAKAAAAAIPSAEEMATKDDIARLEANMATKDDIARLDGRITWLEANVATKDDIAKLDGRITRLEANMVTKEDFAAFLKATDEKFARLEKQIAVLRYAVFTGGPAILAFMAKLTFFP